LARVSGSSPIELWSKKFIFLIVFGALLVGTTAFFKVFNGITTWNQIIFSWALGTWCACLFGFVLRNPIYNHVKALVNDTDEDPKWYGKLPQMAIITGGFMSYFLVFTLIYGPEHFKSLRDGNPFMVQSVDQYKNLANDPAAAKQWANCFFQNPLRFVTYFEDVMTVSGQLIMPLGAYAGILFQNKHYEGQSNYMNYDYDSKKMREFRYTGRLFFYVAFFSIVPLACWIIIAFQQHAYTPENAYLNTSLVRQVPNVEIYFVQYLIPYFVGGFITFAFGDQICYKINLYDMFRKNLGRRRQQGDDFSDDEVT
jgi:hypothetical protein